jgi:hypothetical protein
MLLSSGTAPQQLKGDLQEQVRGGFILLRHDRRGWSRSAALGTFMAAIDCCT